MVFASPNNIVIFFRFLLYAFDNVFLAALSEYSIPIKCVLGFSNACSTKNFPLPEPISIS